MHIRVLDRLNTVFPFEQKLTNFRFEKDENSFKNKKVKNK